LIIWYLPELPPLHVDDGPDSGKGVADLALELAQRELTGYRHEVRHAPLARVLFALQNNTDACTPGLLSDKGARPGLSYSAPYLLNPNPQLLLTPKGVQLAGSAIEKGRIDLVAFLLQQPRLGKVQQVRLGAIDSLVNRYPLLNESSGDQPLHTLARMLKQGHLDAVLIHQGEARWLQQLRPELDSLILMPITPSPVRSEVSIACSDSPLGQQVTRALEPLLKRERLTSIADREAYWERNPGYKEEARRHFGRTGLWKRVPK
jgi:uncharacterized protein (TIGR02285 family)